MGHHVLPRPSHVIPLQTGALQPLDHSPGRVLSLRRSGPGLSLSDQTGFITGDPGLDAVQRTTTAVTIVEAGFKDNVVPGEASAIVNHRIHPSETIEDILDHDRRVIDDERVEITQLGYFPPAPVSPYSNDVTPFQIIANSALEVFPDGKIAPGTLVANTDTKHYLHLTNNVYRSERSGRRMTMTWDIFSGFLQPSL